MTWPAHMNWKTLLPSFGDERTRDSEYAKWVAAGNTLVDGMACVMNGRLEIYREGAWAKAVPV